MLLSQSDLCDYSDAYIAVKGIVTVIGENKKCRKNRFLALNDLYKRSITY